MVSDAFGSRLVKYVMGGLKTRWEVPQVVQLREALGEWIFV